MTLGRTSLALAAVAALVVGCAVTDGSDSTEPAEAPLGQTLGTLARGGPKDPGAKIVCAAGTHCEVTGRKAACVADPVLTCASVLCIVGTVCVETSSGPQCVPIPGAECISDSECRAESNYCGGCSCLVLAPNETAPTCSDPVQCFADPCRVSDGVPACVDGQCVMDARVF